MLILRLGRTLTRAGCHGRPGLRNLRVSGGEFPVLYSEISVLRANS